MTKIGDRFIVDISEIFTFSDCLVLVGSNLREPSVCVTLPSGTTMRRACELVARQGLLCTVEGLQKSMCVRPSDVRVSVRCFFGQFRNRSNGVTKGKTLENRLKNGPKV